jgi:hypothetical protein
MDTQFVVYAYVRERGSKNGAKGTYYYIGKGRPDRPYKDTGRPCRKPKNPKNIIILKTFTEEKLAFEAEKLLIRFYGRLDTKEGWSVLRNKSDGGQGPSGYKRTTETREKISKGMSWENHPQYGKPRTGEEKLRISNGLRGDKNHMFGKTGEKSPWFGKKHTDETKRILSLKHSGINHPQYNKKQSEEWKLKRFENKKRVVIEIDWYNEKYGVVEKTCALDLSKRYPEDNLLVSKLSNVKNGIRARHKGWIRRKQLRGD